MTTQDILDILMASGIVWCLSLVFALSLGAIQYVFKKVIHLL